MSDLLKEAQRAGALALRNEACGERAAANAAADKEDATRAGHMLVRAANINAAKAARREHSVVVPLKEET